MAARVIAVPTPVMYGNFTELVMEGTVHERRLIRQIAELDLNVLAMSAFF